MIIENGYIEVKTKTGGGIDPTTGYPVPVGFAYGDPIPCQYYPNRVNLQGRTGDGEAYTVLGFTILLDLTQGEFNFERIRLSSMSHSMVGEFSVVQVEVLQAVNQIKITV